LEERTNKSNNIPVKRWQILPAFFILEQVEYSRLVFLPPIARINTNWSAIEILLATLFL